MFQRVNLHEFPEVIETYGAARPAMNGKRHVVLFGGIENRPVEFVAIGFAEIGLRRQHHGRKTHPFGSTARDFLRRLYRVLHRNQPGAAEPLVFGCLSVFKPVFTGLDGFDHTFQIRDQTGRQHRRRIQHRTLCPDDLQHFAPGLRIDVGLALGFAVIRCHDKAARPAIEARPHTECFKTLQVGKIALLIGRYLLIVFDHMCIAVENLGTVD